MRPRSVIAEVHQALCANGLRQKVVLRCSGAHQTGSDIITSALLGADSFEFGTSALMIDGLRHGKNCNIKCPAGLTTNPELFDGDPRAMAQYLLTSLTKLGNCSRIWECGPFRKRGVERISCICSITRLLSAI